jgi:hypothetical protein
MGSGTILCGRTSDLEAGTRLAKELLPAQVDHLVKRHEPIYNGAGEVIAQRRVDLSQQEKWLLDAQTLFKNQPKLHFLVKQVGDEQLRPLSLVELDPGVYPDEQRVAELRELLSKKCGTPIEQILTEIKERQAVIHNQQVLPTQKQPKQQHQKQMQPIVQSVTLANSEDERNIPVTPPGDDFTGEDWRDELAD